MYQRTGLAAYKPDLDNSIAICNLLGNPQDKLKCIHVAGTNGKGSTSHMLASVLQEAGYKVGLYTSPHLKDFRERIKINGKPISKKEVVKFTEKHRKDFKKIMPSFFEMTVGLAFDYFAKEKVDIAVIETGLGGRLDSTNVITPILSVITNISFDHTGLLGDTLLKIAAEKAGIIKNGVPVVIGETQHEIEQVFREKARSTNSIIYFADQEHKLTEVHHENKKGHLYLLAGVIKNGIESEKITCDLPGLYQQKNIPTVLKSLEVLSHTFKISEKAQRNGLKRVVKNTGLQGRWQILKTHPLVVCDIAHNEAGIKEVLDQIKTIEHKKLHFVLGMVNDKNIDGIMGLLPKDADYYFCKAAIPRAMEEHELLAKATTFKLHGNTYPSVKKAVKAARAHAGKNDIVFIGGSTFVVAEAL